VGFASTASAMESQNPKEDSMKKSQTGDWVKNGERNAAHYWANNSSSLVEIFPLLDDEKLVALNNYMEGKCN